MHTFRVRDDFKAGSKLYPFVVIKKIFFFVLFLRVYKV